MHEAGEHSLAQGLFGIAVHEPLLEMGFVADLVVAGATNSLEALRAEHGASLDAIARRVLQEEETFAAFSDVGMRSAPRVQVSDVPSWVELGIVAAGLVQVLAERYDVQLGSENSAQAVDLLLQHFPVPLAFVHGLIRDSAAGVLPGGRNSTWDLKVAFHASRGGSIAGVPVLVVSNDQRLLRAAKDASDPLRGHYN